MTTDISEKGPESLIVRHMINKRSREPKWVLEGEATAELWR